MSRVARGGLTGSQGPPVTCADASARASRTALRWCTGWPPQPPHYPDGGATIRANHRDGVWFCRACWLRWNAEDQEVRR